MKDKNKNSQNIVDAGLSQEATEILVSNISTVTQQGAEGTSIDDLATDKSTLICIVLDETGSMVDDRDMVVVAYNNMVEAMKGSKAADEMLISAFAFAEATRLIHSYLPLDLVPELTDYHPYGKTALFDATLDAFTGVVDYEQQLRAGGNRTQVIVGVFTDGDDNYSQHIVSEVKAVSDSLIDQERYILSLVTFGLQGTAERMASEMGFPNLWNAGSSLSEIRRSMQQFSKSAVRASQTQIGPDSQSGFFN